MLNDNCGHHCGIITSGSITHEKHCICIECHGRNKDKDKSNVA